MNKRIKLVIGLLIIFAVLLGSCKAKPTVAPPTDLPKPTELPKPTNTPKPTAAPTAVPTPEGPPDLTGKTITIYHFGDISGPYASITGPLVNGANDMVAYINSHGGIFGANIELKFSDTAGSVDEAVAAYDRFTTEDDNVLMLIMYGSAESEALYERVAEDKIPVLDAGLSSKAFYGIPNGYMFGLGPIYPDQFGYFLDYLVANWDTIKPAGAGDEINLAHISWPTAFGQGSLTAESRAYAAALGVNLVAEEVYDVSPTADTTSAILNAQAAGANVIWTNSLAFGPAALLNDLNALGLRDQFLVAGCNWAMDVATYAFVANPAYAVGLYAPFPFAWWSETDNPAIQFAIENFTANERTAGERNIGRLLLQGGLDLAKHVIEQAILEVGYENLTGEAIYNVLVKTSDYNVLGGLAIADFTNGRRSPNMLQMRMIQGGPDAFVIVQDFTKAPDLRPK